MEINRNNYEIFFMDYLDGNLSGNEIDQFLDFVEQNPDLKDELSGIEELKLPDETIGFSNKQSLYKSGRQKSGTENFTAVAYMEGDLSDLETKLFMKHLEFHPEQTKDLELLMKTRLQADESIVFPAKSKLYRKTIGQQFIFWGTRVAAIWVVMFAFWTIFNISNEKNIIENHQALVENTEIQTGKPEIIEAPKPEMAEVKIITTPTSEIKKSKSLVLPVEEVTKVESSQDRKAENMELLRPIFAQLEPVRQSNETILAEMQADAKTENSPEKYYTVNSYFVEKVLKIKRGDNSEHKSLFESGLDLASNVSGERIQYETEQGKVSKISFDTRLLAFSIPIKK